MSNVLRPLRPRYKVAQRPGGYPGGYSDRHFSRPITTFVSKAKVPAGTYMMNNDLKKAGLGDTGIWDDVPTNMQLRSLRSDGTTRIDTNRLIQDDEPFYVTGEAYVSRTGNVVLVQVVPTDGYPGWVELTKVDEHHQPGTSGDLALDCVNAWFTQRFDKVRRSHRHG